MPRARAACSIHPLPPPDARSPGFRKPMPMPDTAANSPDPRYAASVRLSVAPMMDWT